jgi:N-acetylmuramoyl-L-alanine amidase
MNKKILLIKISVIILFCTVFVPLNMREDKASAFSNQVIQHGAVGEDVIELQSRLQYLGFYNGKIDGVFGWGTYWALRNFQYEFGLPVDGLAGWPTKIKLANASKYNEQYVKEQISKGKKFTHYGGVDLNKQQAPKGAGGGKEAPKPAQTQQPKTATKPPATGQTGTTAKTKQAQKPSAVNVPNGFSQNDIQLMANAVYGEARGEPYIGQVAIAAVILNRVDSASFPNTISGVIFEPRAFTAVADGQIWLTPNEQAKKAVLDAMNGWDPTGNAIYYFNPDTATSGWIWSRQQIKQIGKHIFCK